MTVEEEERTAGRAMPIEAMADPQAAGRSVTRFTPAAAAEPSSEPPAQAVAPPPIFRGALQPAVLAGAPIVGAFLTLLAQSPFGVPLLGLTPVVGTALAASAGVLGLLAMARLPKETSAMVRLRRAALGLAIGVDVYWILSTVIMAPDLVWRIAGGLRPLQDGISLLSVAAAVLHLSGIVDAVRSKALQVVIPGSERRRRPLPMQAIAALVVAVLGLGDARPSLTLEGLRAVESRGNDSVLAFALNAGLGHWPTAHRATEPPGSGLDRPTGRPTRPGFRLGPDTDTHAARVRRAYFRLTGRLMPVAPGTPAVSRSHLAVGGLEAAAPHLTWTLEIGGFSPDRMSRVIDLDLPEGSRLLDLRDVGEGAGSGRFGEATARFAGSPTRIEVTTHDPSLPVIVALDIALVPRIDAEGSAYLALPGLAWPPLDPSFSHDLQTGGEVRMIPHGDLERERVVIGPPALRPTGVPDRFNPGVGRPSHVVTVASRVETTPPPERLILLIDGSRALGRADLLPALWGVIGDVRVDLVLAGAGEPAVLENADRGSAGTFLSGHAFSFGQDNAAALAHALDLAKSAPRAAVIWLSGPQPFADPAAGGWPAIEDLVVPRLKGLPAGQRIIAIALGEGANDAFLSPAVAGRIERYGRAAALAPALIGVHRWLAAGGPRLRHSFDRQPASPGLLSLPSAGGDDVARLWALAAARQLAVIGSAEAACRLLDIYRIGAPDIRSRAGCTP